MLFAASALQPVFYERGNSPTYLFEKKAIKKEKKKGRNSNLV